MYLEKINCPDDLKKLSIENCTELAGEIRSALIQKMSVCGGHLASNLGVIELTIGLHYVFDAPQDKIIFDVSHQTYCHKMLTGRKDAFVYEEKYNTISGYSNPKESEYDLFPIGHTSTSISLACGMALTRDLKGDKENVIAVIGDASLDGGQAFEALNFAGEMDSGLIVVLNDNDMSIPENHGILNKKLNELRANHGEITDNYFKALGFEYIFVRNGHSIPDIIKALNRVKGTKNPVVVHVCTQKGRGYKFAEVNREQWHWARPFNISTGEFLSKVPDENYGAIVSEFLIDKMQRDSDIIVVAASTPLCIGFHEEKRKRAGKQFVDVGIAEQNAISVATGIAKRGGKPVFATNSTFYQRAYDQIEQEMCIGENPVTMLVTHASVFGHANDTHAGLFDIALLGNIPHLVYLAPTNKQEYLAMLNWSIEQTRFPVAIRVPWTSVYETKDEVSLDYSQTKYKVTISGKKLAVLALGSFYYLGEQVVKECKNRMDIQATLINPRFITGIDEETLNDLEKEHDLVITLEDGIVRGGFGSKISQFFSSKNVKVINYGFSMDIPKKYVPIELMKQNKLTPEKIVNEVMMLL